MVKKGCDSQWERKFPERFAESGKTNKQSDTCEDMTGLADSPVNWSVDQIIS